MPVKHMSNKTAMRPKPLPRHHIAHTLFLLRHITYMISTCIHDHIFIRLFKATIDPVSARCLDPVSYLLTSSHSSTPAASAPPALNWIITLPQGVFPEAQHWDLLVYEQVQRGCFEKGRSLRHLDEKLRGSSTRAVPAARPHLWHLKCVLVFE